MRVISGSASGVSLRAPKGDLTRPTTDRVRSSIFSILGDRVARASVLDLFAGSGTLGIESLSRGAASAVFVEARKEACSCIEDNLRRAGLTAGRVVRQSVEAFLSGQAQAGSLQYDLVFADPPYATRPGDTDFGAALIASPNLPRIVAPLGVLILEAPRDTPDPQSPLWELVEARNYGTNMIQFFQPRAPAPTA
ncbi:MAG: 16S rRNA (guanine(966)-N(2))-methyltransferase RsmD [Verrucomicrobia bacterium]|nr:16S rRNA (guanine(966)-N(2))-methyltransferase RsmD [Verrucomicrobiota bacterium]